MNEIKSSLVNGGYPLHTFDEVKELYFAYIFNKNDRQKIQDAYDLMMVKHQNQFRKSGEPYFHHLIEVAYILASLHGGPETIEAGLLHDVVEDTNTPIEEIEKQFGPDVAKLVDSLTKIQNLKLSKIESKDFEAEDHRKIFIGMAKDIRVIIIKLADRLHNMRTLPSLTPERQIALSKETFEVFVPIAHRLGLETIKNELADICLSYLYPEKFHLLVETLFKKQKTLQKSLDSFSKRIADELFERHIPFELESRVKSLNSIFHKMYSLGHSFEQIYDILALRIITEEEAQCYEILGIIHHLFVPVPGRFKDYIASPKSNLYQSLHTTVMSGDGKMYEIQIRTRKMDEVAESGVAAHWAYKEGVGYNSKKEQEEIENKLHWFRDFVSLSNESNNEQASTYMDNLTHDVFEANVYVFTPTGKVIELSNGSTPIDFAYRIHSKVGETAIGAVVNGILVPLNTVLKTGDVVEIKTSKNSEPNEGWLEYAKTSGARQQIRKFLAKKNADLLREDKIAKGKQSCLDAFKDRNVNEEEMIKYLSNPNTLEHFSVPSLDDLYIAVCNRKPTPNAIIEFLKIKKPVSIVSKGKITNKDDNVPVYCRGTDRIAINLANCCTPVPGDSIVGYITKGSGITVHRQNCPNVVKESERLIDVYWKENLPFANYPCDIVIEANDRESLLSDVANLLANAKVPLSDIHSNFNRNRGVVSLFLTIHITDVKRLTDIFNSLLGIKGVFNVRRITH